jgi:hypothetical protein
MLLRLLKGTAAAAAAAAVLSLNAAAMYTDDSYGCNECYEETSIRCSCFLYWSQP